MKILVTPTSFPKKKGSEACELLSAFAGEIVWNPYGRPLGEEELPELLQGVDAWIAGVDYITAGVINKAPDSLKVISRYGVGYERVDVAAAAMRGIAVTNTPGANTEAVADLAFGLMLAVARKIPALDKRIKSGEWPRSNGIELYKKTIGIIGFGAIGRSVARRAAGFSMKIIACDPYLDKNYAKENDILIAGIDELLEKSDVVTLHLPLSADTENLINFDRVKRMKQGAILINTSRGGIVDEEALLAALKEGRLGGVGLDAFCVEPPGESPLFAFDNVVATPHSGAHTSEAAANMALLSVQNLIAVLKGEACQHIIHTKR